jgi:hypothetical protein
MAQTYDSELNLVLLLLMRFTLKTIEGIHSKSSMNGRTVDFALKYSQVSSSFFIMNKAEKIKVKKTTRWKRTNQYLLVVLVFTCTFNVQIGTVMYMYSIFWYFFTNIY